MDKIFDLRLKILMIETIEIWFNIFWNADLLLNVKFKGNALSKG